MDICCKFATFQVSLFIHSLRSFQSRLSMSADLQRLNICFYFGNTFVMHFSLWCQRTLGIKCLFEETSSVTYIAAFKSSCCMCPGEFVFCYGLSKACLTKFCRWFDAIIILRDCMSLPVNVAHLLTLSMSSFFVVFYAVHFSLVTAEISLWEWMLAHFIEEKGGKLGYWVEMMETVAMLSWTILTLGTWVSKGGDRQGTSLHFKNLTFSHQIFSKKDCLISVEW